MSNDFDDTESDSVSTIIFEMNALQAALSVVENTFDREEAKSLIRKALKRKSPPRTLEEHVVVAAMQRISGEKISPPKVGIRESSWDFQLTDTTASSWLAWTRGENVSAANELKPLLQKKLSRSQEETAGKAGAVRRMSITFWAEAVSLLAREDRLSAQRYFRRAIDLGSQFGTETHPVISWSYAASFFPIENSTSED